MFPTTQKLLGHTSTKDKAASTVDDNEIASSSSSSSSFFAEATSNKKKKKPHHERKGIQNKTNVAKHYEFEKKIYSNENIQLQLQQILQHDIWIYNQVKERRRKQKMEEEEAIHDETRMLFHINTNHHQEHDDQLLTILARPS